MLEYVAGCDDPPKVQGLRRDGLLLALSSAVLAAAFAASAFTVAARAAIAFSITAFAAPAVSTISVAAAVSGAAALTIITTTVTGARP